MDQFETELQPLKTALLAGYNESAMQEEIKLLRSLLEEAIDPLKDPDDQTLGDCLRMIDRAIGRF